MQKPRNTKTQYIEGNSMYFFGKSPSNLKIYTKKNDFFEENLHRIHGS